jgi:hypothetical protein
VPKYAPTISTVETMPIAIQRRTEEERSTSRISACSAVDLKGD